jgi:Zn-dependent peptidase ImmA (M78 family)
MDRKIIVERAEELAKEYNPEGLSPFPYERIGEKMKNVQIYILDIEDQAISGAISFDKEEKNYKIIINKQKPFTRQHFTIAHELGHYFLHLDLVAQEEVLVDTDESLRQNAVLFRLDSATSSRIETEANYFAAALIMPETWVRKAWETFRNIEECARLFNVSTTAMSIRLETLQLVS